MEAGKKYEIEKKFTGGFLNGMVIREQTSVKFEVGFECMKPVGGSPYKIIAVEEVN